MVVDSFQQHRASVIGGTGAKVTPSSSGSASFLQHRAQVISQPSKPITTSAPTPVSTPSEPVSKGPSFIQKAGEQIKRKGTGVLQGLGDVATSLLDAFQMVAERYESKQPVKETKKVSGELPKPITSLLKEEKPLKPLTPVQEQVQKVSKESPTPRSPKSQIYSVMSEPIKRWSEEVNPKDPTFADMLARGVGSMGGYLLLSSITGASAGSLALVEAASEAGSVYSTNREKGMDVGEASIKADKDFLANLVINYVTNKVGLFGDGANKIKKAIVSATTEGTQEALQQITSNSQTDRPIMEGVLESAGVGSIIGGSVSVIMPDGTVSEITGEQEKEKIVPVKEATNIKDLAPTQIIAGGVPTTTVETTDETLKTLVKLDSAIQNYKSDQGVTVLPSKEVTLSPALRELTALSSKPEVIAKTQSEVASLPRDEDGKITLYRVGTLRPGDERLVSASVTREAAEAFAELKSVSAEARPLTAFKVDPQDIKVFIGGTEAEVLVQNPVKAQPAPSMEGVKLQSTDELIKFLGEGGFRTDEQIAKLRLDIEQNGIKYPIEIVKQEDGSYIINDGNHRLQIAQDLGIKEVPVKEVTETPAPKKYSDLTPEEQAKADKQLTDQGIEVTKGAEIVQEKPPESPTLPKEEKPSPGEEVENEIVNTERGGDLTISPSTATTVEEVLEEVKSLGLPESVVKSVFTTKPSDKMKYGGRMVVGYTRPFIGKTELKTMLANAPEFKENPVLTVDHNKNLVFEGQRVHFSMKPEALQLSAENIKPGDTIRVDEEALKKGSQQLRIRNSKGDVLGFNPKNLADPFSPTATDTMTEIVKQSDIAQTLSEKLGVPIRRGKFRRAGAIGIYKGSPKVIRIKKGGLNTIFHEVAHYLDDTIGLSENITPEEVENLIQEYGNPPENKVNRKKEAFAEYMRFRMTGQSEKIKEWAPGFDKMFSEKLDTMPDVKSVIETASQDYARWAALPSTSKILSQLSIGKQREGTFKERAVNAVHEVYTSVLDDLHPLSEFSGLAQSRIGNIEATADPYVLARNLRGWVGKADMFLNQGTFRKQFWTTGENGKIQMNFTGKSYSEILKPVEEMGALDDFRVFIVAERIVNDLAPRKIETGIALSDAKAALEELKAKYPDFERISEERRAYKDSLLEYAKDTGLVGAEGLKKIKELNKYHVPFYRVMEETGAKFLGKSKIGGNLSSPIKRIKGSEREIIDPLESDVKDTYAIINASERNNIGVAMANLASRNFELGRLFEKVDRPMKGTKVNVGEVIEKAVKGTDAENLEIPEDLADAVVTLFRPTQASGPNMLNVNLGDKQAVYEVDPDLFKAIQGLNIEDVGIVMKILSFPASMLRAGATLSPDFSVRNPLRDQFTAFVYSKHGFIPGVDLVRGMFELFKKGDTYNLWKAGGGEHATFVSLDRVETQKTLKQILKSKGMQNLDYVKNPINLLRIISELGEMGTRLGEMRNALARGTNPVEAAYDARNVTLDFSRVGAKTRAVNAIIAFFNANIQASDTMVRKFKNRPFQSLFKAMISMTLPSVLLYFANRDDDRWKEIPQWQKDLFWIVLTKDHIWRIPKPFELGILFGSVPERILEVIDTKDPEMLNELRRTIVNGFTPGFLPTTLIPIIENITNYSFFTDRPIVSRGKENLPPEQQAGPYTTEVSKILGEALNYSPAKIDNLVQGYGGGIGKYVTQGLDSILKGTGTVYVPPEPAKTLDQLPVIKAFMVRDPIGSGSESVNRVYEQYSKTNAQMNYVKQLVKDGEGDKAKKYLEDHPDTLQAIILTATVDSFSEMNKAVDAVRDSKTLTPQEKRKRIDQIGILQTNTAKKVLESLKAKNEED